MSKVEHEGAAELAQLLAGTAQAIARVRYCWLLTTAASGAINARPMGRLTRDLDSSDWTIRFLIDRRSRKASDIRQADEATVNFQNSDDAFASLVGPATLCEAVTEVRRHWKTAYDSYFPTEHDRAHAALIEVRVRRMELWIRGVTPEPFGLRPSRIERDAQGAWQRCD